MSTGNITDTRLSGGQRLPLPQPSTSDQTQAFGYRTTTAAPQQPPLLLTPKVIGTEKAMKILETLVETLDEGDSPVPHSYSSKRNPESTPAPEKKRKIKQQKSSESEEINRKKHNRRSQSWRDEMKDLVQQLTEQLPDYQEGQTFTQKETLQKTIKQLKKLKEENAQLLVLKLKPEISGSSCKYLDK